MSNPTDDRRPREPRRSASNPKPKGILKNAGPQPLGGQQRLQWDEENLALTEIQKDSVMKITEPKTPYVRYNAETDEVEGDIPQLELGGARSPGLPTEPLPASPTSGIASGHSSRRASLSSVGKNSSGRSGSVTSSRSTSFSLPNDSKAEVKAGEGTLVDSDVEDDGPMDEEAAEKHAEFVKARNRHYSKEAEAMKRTAPIPDEDEEEPGKDAEGDELAGDHPGEGSVAAGQTHGHGLANGAMHQ